MDNRLRKLINSKLKVETVLKNLGLKYSNGGEEYKISCPFHEERTPSCFINSKKNMFHCFGCQKAGDLIFLISKVKKTTTEAVLLEYSKLSEFPKTLNDYQQYMALTEEPIDPDEQYIDDLQFLLEAEYSLLKIYYDKMKRLPVFSDYEVKYHNLDTRIMNLEEEIIAYRVALFEKKHPPKILAENTK